MVLLPAHYVSLHYQTPSIDTLLHMDQALDPLLCFVDVGLGTENFMNAAYAGRIIVGTSGGQTVRILAADQCLPDGIDFSAATGQVFWTSMGMPPGVPNGAVYS